MIKKGYNISLPIDLHKQLKQHVVKNDITISEFVELAINKQLKNKGVK